MKRTIFLLSLMMAALSTVLQVSLALGDDQQSGPATTQAIAPNGGAITPGSTPVPNQPGAGDQTGTESSEEQEPELTEDQKHYMASNQCFADEDYEGALRELDAALAVFPVSLLYKVQRQFVELQIAASAIGDDQEKLQQLVADWVKDIKLPPSDTPQITTPEAYQAFIVSSAVTVVDFTAVWCAPCQMLVPYLAKIEAAYGPVGVKFARIDFDEIATEENEEFIKQIQLGPIPDVRIYAGGRLFAQVKGTDPFLILFYLDCAVHAVGGYRPRQPDQQAQPSQQGQPSQPGK